MQNDLISRSAVMEMLTNIELSCTPIPMIEAKLQLRDIPCAYDVEKVVEQIKNISFMTVAPPSDYEMALLRKNKELVIEIVRNCGKE